MHIFISRQATVLEMHALMCKRYALETDSKYTVEELLELSRLWKFEGNETIEDAKSMLAEINTNDLSSLPLAIQARLLKPEQLIDEIDVAD